MSDSTEIFVDIMSEQTATAAATKTIEFDEAFTLHHRTVFRAARSVVHDVGLAEDVTQEVFIKLYKHKESIKDPEMLRPWLIRVALNLAKNTIRGNIRANTRDENYVQEMVETKVFSVESDYEQQTGVNEIYRALDKVKEPLRSCLVLKQQGLSYREIAESLSLNETSIGTYVARARQEFLKFYGNDRRDLL
ncbi:MAG TPA: sigma-70 family RNA polymerase sigma factor [Pyrinomonadaceae bacterium]|nr:sigma-70 family RNA polymerase sigma factor [Pyrinomonadaceae bacterium]